MNIRHRIFFLVVLAFLAIAAIGGYAIFQSRINAAAVKAVTEGVMPSALAAADLASSIKDVQLTTVAMVAAPDRNSADLAAQKLKALKAQILESVELQRKQADSDAERGLVQQTQESLGNYFAAIDQTAAFMLSGQKGLAEATLYANVAEYRRELGEVSETLRIEKNRSKDAAILGLNARLSTAVWTVSLVTLLAAVALGVVGIRLYLQIANPLRQIQMEVASIHENLDLTHRIPVAGTDEIGQVAGSVNSLLNDFQAIVRGVQVAGNHVSQTSDELSHSVGQLLTAIEIQNESTSSMAAAVQEMAVSVNHVADSTTVAQGIARTSRAQAENGSQVIEETAREMGVMAEAVQGTSLAMEELGRRTDEIGSIAAIIKDIADQTNLLALNAAIEAARAGEMGRGFAVVADEVRKLAERTTSATKEIATVVGAIQGQTRQAVDDMHRLVIQAGSNANGARQAGESISRMREGSVRVVEVSSEIAVALQEQRAASEQIAKQVEKIAAMSETNTAAMSEAKEGTTHLKNVSAEMHQLVARFQA